jgi:uncharacterized protein DUF6636
VPPAPRRRLPLFLAGAALLASAPAATASLVHFRTPSGNIGCIGDRTGIRCDIRSMSVPPPTRPRGCDLDYGDAFTMSSRGRARLVCHGDTALGGRSVLAYGRSRRIGPFLCVSRATGLTCRNRAGHGWFLSRERIRVF